MFFKCFINWLFSILFRVDYIPLYLELRSLYPVYTEDPVQVVDGKQEHLVQNNGYISVWIPEV